MALIAENGTIVARYDYDAYGKLLSVKDASGAEITDLSHIANLNPIRYRGYYFDSETGFYYLNSRYYDPEICRFISPDDASLLGANGTIPSYNLYAYCENNPVNCVDEDGNLSELVAAAIGGAIAGGLVSTFSYLADCAMNGVQIDAKDFVIAVGKGALNGAAGAVIGAISTGNWVLTAIYKLGSSLVVGCWDSLSFENHDISVQMGVLLKTTVSTFIGSLVPVYKESYGAAGNLCTNLMGGISTGAVMETIFGCHSQNKRNKQNRQTGYTPNYNGLNYAGYTHGKSLDPHILYGC